MSIGKNLMALLSILAFGFVCFVSGALHVKNPETVNWAYPILVGVAFILPNLFEIINGLGPYDDDLVKDEPKKSESKKRRVR